MEEVKYPKGVFLILVDEFCERFCFYGLRTLLSIYLHNVLEYSVDNATAIFHVFTFLCYFTPILGAVIADGLIGKFATIIILSVVYAVGTSTLSLASADTALPGMPVRTISLIGLFLIGTGTGGIKPCVSAFGGDQFTLPQQQKQLGQFFSIFYFAINIGSLTATFTTPILKANLSCLDKDTCYPAAFGISSVLMVTAIDFGQLFLSYEAAKRQHHVTLSLDTDIKAAHLIFTLGKPLYKINKPQGVVFNKIFHVIGNALSTKRKSTEKKDHWLDYAAEKHGEQWVADIKAMLRVIVLYIPLPFFWALFDQQASRWTFQASMMDGTITDSWSLQPEQMQLLNPLFVLAILPLFDFAIYPLLAKCHLLTKPLQRITCGGTLAAVAFLLSAGLEIYLEPTYAVIPGAGEGQLRFYNGFDCPVSVELGDSSTDISALGVWERKALSVEGEKEFNLKIALDKSCSVNLTDVEKTVTLIEKQAKSYLITGYTEIELKGDMPNDDVEKNKESRPKLRVIYSFFNPTNETSKTLECISSKGDETKIPLDLNLAGTDYVLLRVSSYTVKVDDETIASELNIEGAGVYTLLVHGNENGTIESELYTVTPPNSVHMLWLIPQYLVITMGEVMFSVTGLHFSFTQAPVSMKSAIQAAWLLTTAFGNIIVIIIAEAQLFNRQLYEFLLFAALMFANMAIFALMAWRYKYVEYKEEGSTN